jgi:thioredoxin-related protein
MFNQRIQKKMKKILSTLLTLSIPFMVVSCNEGNSPAPAKKQDKADIKAMIKQKNAYADIKWVDIADIDKMMEKEPKKIMLFFYKDGCPYCKEMKEVTLQDFEVIKLINDNFYPVMFNGRSKDSIVFNGETFVNQHLDPKMRSFHDLHQQYAKPWQENYYWPTTTLLSKDYQSLRSLPGLQKPPSFKRILQNVIKQNP